jgi:hypothetical protein
LGPSHKLVRIGPIRLFLTSPKELKRFFKKLKNVFGIFHKEKNIKMFYLRKSVMKVDKNII